MLRDSVGVLDISNFANYFIKGPGAFEWLDKLLANKIPTVIGRSCLAPLIGVRGGIAGDFTVTKLADDEYMMVGSGLAERYHHRFFEMVALPEGTIFENKTDTICGFNVAGPRARDLLQRLTNHDLSNENFRFMRSAKISVGGVEVIALRVSFTGDLGWELHCAQEDQVALYTALVDAARELGGGPVGGRALSSLRIEKGYGSWGREYSPEYWPQELGLAGLVKMDKEFLHKEAYAALAESAPRETLCMLEMDANQNADASGGEPIFLKDGTPVGKVSSGAYGYHVDKSLALGMIKHGAAGPGDEVEIFVLGQPHKARILSEPAFDPSGARLRG